jgi:hypothetical protein
MNKSKSTYAESMRQASMEWKIPLELLRVAKGKGCPAFAGSRVRRAELEAWLKANPQAVADGKSASDAAELKRQKTEAEVELLRAKLARERAAVVRLDEAREETERCMRLCFEQAELFLSPDIFKVFKKRVESRIGPIFAI